MTSYPNAYCVKCGRHTDTEDKHTVLLQNNSRALRGVCSACASQVYKILPKKRQAGAPKGRSGRYPDAYCVKCGEHTPTKNSHTVLLENDSRALKGECGRCGSEVYRILGGQKGRAAASDADEGMAQVIQHPKSRGPIALRHNDDNLDRRAPSDGLVLERRRRLASLAVALGLIGCIVAGFFLYSLF